MPVTEAKINVEEQIENLEKRLKQPVPDLKVQHVGLEVADVQQLTRMAAQRIKPFNANGHGFRDSAIWVTLMRYAQSVDRTVGFISENKNDFKL